MISLVVQKQINEIEKQKQILENKRISLIQKTFIKCESSVLGKGCGKSTQINKLIYMDFNWYESPYSCTGGDRYHSGEGHFICPKCGRLNRMYNREDYQKLNYYFKNHIDVTNQLKSIVQVLNEQLFSRELCKKWKTLDRCNRWNIIDNRLSSKPSYAFGFEDYDSINKVELYYK